MKAFILTMFCLHIVNAIITMTQAAGDHPREREPVSVGFDLVCLVLNLALIAWAAYLLWGQS